MMINSIEIDEFLGYSTGKIVCNDSFSRYAMNLKNTFKILWVEKGSVKITLNGFTVLLEKNQCLFINKNASLIFSSMEDFCLSYIQFNEELLNNNDDLSLLISYSNLFDKDKLINKLALNGKYFSIIKHYLDLLTNLQFKEKNSLNRLLSQNTLIQVILLAISLFNEENDGVLLSKKKSYNDLILERFTTIVNNNIRNERNVKFYCDKMGVDHNLLNKICISEYGVNVKTYLDLKCLNQIKRILSTTTLSSKEVSYYFNFSDTSNFLRFFKRLTDMTVSEYRTRINKSNKMFTYASNQAVLS